MIASQLEKLHSLGPHVFHEIAGGHVLLVQSVPDQQVVVVRDQIPIACMFEIHRLMATDGTTTTSVGYLFSSQFKTVNNGGHIVTFLESKRGLAEKSEILIKSEDLVLIHFPNRGTMAISPTIDDYTLSLIHI